MSDKKKSGGKKKARDNRAAKRKQEEEERKRAWEDEWEKKLDAKEKLDDVQCCMGEELALKPRTQSNIWINVTQDGPVQEILMSFKHAPVPRPKPPPLPPKMKVTIAKNTSMEKQTSKKADKKSGSGKRKMKK